MPRMPSGICRRCIEPDLTNLATFVAFRGWWRSPDRRPVGSWCSSCSCSLGSLQRKNRVQFRKLPQGYGLCCSRCELPCSLIWVTESDQPTQTGTGPGRGSQTPQLQLRLYTSERLRYRRCCCADSDEKSTTEFGRDAKWIRDSARDSAGPAQPDVLTDVSTGTVHIYDICLQYIRKLAG